MKKEKSSGVKRILPLAVTALSAVVVMTCVVLIATTGTKAKYTTDKVVNQTPVTVTVTADLASNLEVKESKATRNPSGTYSLVTNELVKNNTYVLMPGVSIPKDPKVYVTGKTSIPAYLYVEVVNDTGLVTEGNNAALKYSLVAPDWTKLDGVQGRHGGEVYAYKDVLQTEGTNTEDYTVSILDPVYNDGKDSVMVTSFFNADSANYLGTLTFYAYMAQKAGDAAPDATFESEFPPLPPLP